MERLRGQVVQRPKEQVGFGGWWAWDERVGEPDFERGGERVLIKDNFEHVYRCGCSRLMR